MHSSRNAGTSGKESIFADLDTNGALFPSVWLVDFIISLELDSIAQAPTAGLSTRVVLPRAQGAGMCCDGKRWN